MSLDSFSYKSTEKPFIDYFNRLLDVGFSMDEIENKLPQLEKYFREMVINEMTIEEIFIGNYPTLNNLFKKWKLFYD